MRTLLDAENRMAASWSLNKTPSLLAKDRLLFVVDAQRRRRRRQTKKP